MSSHSPTGGQPDPQGPHGPGGPGSGFGQPSGPAYGAPGGYGAQPQPPYSAPGQPVGPGLGGPALGGPGPAGAPGPYAPMGQPPHAPGYAPGPSGPMGPGQPGWPPSNGNRSKLPLIIGAAVLALIILGVAGGLLASRGNDTAGTAPVGPAGQSQSASASAPAPVAATASDAVRSYLEALAAGKAATALALGDSQPADKTFLTDAVLADSNSRAPITDIQVPEVTDEYAFRVDASYKLGSEAVTEDFSVRKVGSGWKLTKTFNEVNLGFVRSKTLAMLINKVPVKTDKVRLFPGSYAFTSGTPYVNYGEESTVLLKSPSDYTSTTSDLKPTLTEAGTTAFEKAVESKLRKCAQNGELAPSGCPNRIREASYQKIDDDTAKWKLSEESLDNLRTRLNFENPVIAEATGSVEYTFEAKGTQFDRKAVFGPQRVTTYLTMSANMSEEPLKVNFK